jgi:hypothetical protein
MECSEHIDTPWPRTLPVKGLSNGRAKDRDTNITKGEGSIARRIFGALSTSYRCSLSNRGIDSDCARDFQVVADWAPIQRPVK